MWLKQADRRGQFWKVGDIPGETAKETGSIKGREIIAFPGVITKRELGT